MTRALRLQYAGALYHVINRGNARQRVFLDDADHLAFLDLLGQCCVEFDWHCHAHCLMPNHYHLLLETRAANLSRGMRQLGGVFTQRYNARHARVGHLFQGRYKALLVESDRYLMTVARYIVLNPVRAGLVADPARWRWSAYRWLAGQATAPAWASPGPLWSRLASDEREAASAFVAECAAPAKPLADDDARRLGMLGSSGFRRAQRRRLASRRDEPQHTVAARFADRPSLDRLFGAPGAREPGPVRDAAIVEAVRRWHYSQAEVAAALGLHPGSVWRMLARGRRLKNET